MIRDAVRAGLLPEQILETRLSEVIETATSTCLSALDNDEQATAKLYVQKAAQAADEAWQQTVSGLQGPCVANPTIATLEHPSSVSQDEDSTSQRPGRADSVGRSFHDSLIGLVSGARRTRSSQRVHGSRSPGLRTCHAQVSHKWLYHLDACAGSVLTPYDRITHVQKRLGNRIWVGGGQC